MFSTRCDGAPHRYAPRPGFIPPVHATDPWFSRRGEIHDDARRKVLTWGAVGAQISQIFGFGRGQPATEENSAATPCSASMVCGCTPLGRSTAEWARARTAERDCALGPKPPAKSSELGRAQPGCAATRDYTGRTNTTRERFPILQGVVIQREAGGLGSPRAHNGTGAH